MTKLLRPLALCLLLAGCAPQWVEMRSGMTDAPPNNSAAAVANLTYQARLHALALALHGEAVPADIVNDEERSVVGFRPHGAGVVLEVRTGADEVLPGAPRAKRAEAALEARVAAVLECCHVAHLLGDDLEFDGVLVGASFDEITENVSDSLGRIFMKHRVVTTAYVPMRFAKVYISAHIPIAHVLIVSKLTLDGADWATP